MSNKKSQEKKSSGNSKNIPDHIDEYFKKSEGSKEAIQSRELFSGDNDNIVFKTDLTNEEISLITTLKFNDQFLKARGLSPLFMKYFNNYMKLKVSKDRQSRGEFVNINKQDNQDDIIDKASSLKNLTDPRK